MASRVVWGCVLVARGARRSQSLFTAVLTPYSTSPGGFCCSAPVESAGEFITLQDWVCKRYQGGLAPPLRSKAQNCISGLHRLNTRCSSTHGAWAALTLPHHLLTNSFFLYLLKGGASAIHIHVTFKNQGGILHLFILCIRILHIKQFKCKSLGANPASGPGCRVKPTHARDAWRMMSLE